jgi:hypothetical protein
MLKYLSEHSIQEFANSFIDHEEIVHSCYFVIKQRKINCPKPVYYYSIIELDHLSVKSLLFGEINETETSLLINIGIEKYLEKIVIELNTDFDIVLEIYQSIFEGTQLIEIETNEINNLFYSFNTISKTSSHKKYCENKMEGIFGNSSYDNFIISCFLENLNKTHSCLPLISSQLFVRIEYDLKIIGYKFCSTEIMGNLSQIGTILSKCYESFDPECNVELFEINVKSTQIKGKLNQTILNIIPKAWVKPHYSESLKTDLNELIYNCGGVIGLWSGLSAVSIVYGTITFFCTKLPKHIKTSFIFLKHLLRRVFDFVSFITITIKDLFIRIFLSILYYIRYCLKTLKIFFKQTVLSILYYIRFSLKTLKILFIQIFLIFCELIHYLIYIVKIKIILLYRAMVNKLRFAVRVRPLN